MTVLKTADWRVGAIILLINTELIGASAARTEETGARTTTAPFPSTEREFCTASTRRAYGDSAHDAIAVAIIRGEEDDTRIVCICVVVYDTQLMHFRIIVQSWNFWPYNKYYVHRIISNWLRWKQHEFLQFISLSDGYKLCMRFALFIQIERPVAVNNGRRKFKRLSSAAYGQHKDIKFGIKKIIVCFGKP